MAYRLKIRDASVADGVRRIAREQISAALESVQIRDSADAVHDIRKRCKKLRGLIRLIRPHFEGYAEENAAFRDVAQAISDARDAKVMQDSYDRLMLAYGDQVDRQAMESIRRGLAARRYAEVDDAAVTRTLTAQCLPLAQACERAQSWKVDADGWEALEGGFTKTYRRARKISSQARSCPQGAIFHELRKSIKYHWYHCRLLENLWPDMMGARQRCAKRLSDILGDHHDLDVFAASLTADPAPFGRESDVEVAVGLARARQAHLEANAWQMLDRLLAQSPKALNKHCGALWEAWRNSD